MNRIIFQLIENIVIIWKTFTKNLMVFEQIALDSVNFESGKLFDIKNVFC